MAVTLRERVKQLRELKPQIDQKIASSCEEATVRAIETAMEKTPPTEDSPLAGTHMRTGEMKQRWAVDSTVTPVKARGRYKTSLANGVEYAAYVNDGHRMDRHFVPGLYVNEESGLIEFDPMKRTGMMVGTKTKYVPGLFIVDAAKETYRRVLRQELGDIGEVLR